jgi:hypothetical protein
LNGLVSAPRGITGATGSFTSLTSGNVGVGITSPQCTFQVVNTSTNTTAIQAAFTQTTNFNEGTILSCNGTITEIKMNNSSPGAHFTISNDGAFKINNTSDSTAPFTTGTNNLSILTSGNVGIGNSNPLQTLDVNGTLGVSGITTLGNNLVFSNIPSGSREISFSGGTDAAFIRYRLVSENNAVLEIGTNDDGFEPINFLISGNTVMTISSGTNRFVGIGTTTPGQLLDVNGTCRATSFISGSDYRLKTNIEPLLPSRTIDDLKPVEYDLSGNTHDMGFIAHEVEETLPFLVHGEKDGENMQSLNYNGFIALLVKEVQDLKRDKKALEERLDRLEKIFLEKYKKQK